MNIYLIGFMGTGKSAVGKALQKETDYKIVDMDAEIVRREKRKISEIFEKEGEEYFRALETHLLEELEKQDHCIVSCGGGVVLKDENRGIMHRSGITVLLTARPETILTRVKNDHSRPLLEGKKDVDSIKEMLQQRMPFYEKAANVIVPTDEKSPQELANRIVDFLKGF
ncbi:MAG: shikimate kinase [Lachnospiraceae bacterium]|nr:shikimate kinase [Lachnospiraceae bacterium]